jgi:hypothetical protein
VSARIDDVLDLDASRNNFRQHRLKHEVVLAIDERDFNIRKPASHLLEVHRRVHAAKAAAQDDNIFHQNAEAI